MSLIIKRKFFIERKEHCISFKYNGEIHSFNIVHHYSYSNIYYNFRYIGQCKINIKTFILNYLLTCGK